MKNILTPSANDQSLHYLSQIFGSMPGSLVGKETLMSTMFQVFNSTVLGVAIFIIVYVVIITVLTSAAEGEFLGRKYHGVWTPLRMVLGVASLVPGPSGYSGLQIIMMWVIVQGIGAADQVWTAVVNRVMVTGTAYAATGPTTSSIGANYYLKELFRGLTCAYTTQQPDPHNLFTSLDNFKGYRLAGASSSSGTQPYTNECAQGSDRCYITFSPEGQCGQFIYSNPAYYQASQPSSLAAVASQAQKEAIDGILAAYDPLAQQFAQADYDYVDFYYRSSYDIDNNKQGWSSKIQAYCSAKGISPYCCNPNPANSNNLCQSNATSDDFPNPGTTDLSNIVIHNIVTKYAFDLNVNAVQVAVDNYQTKISTAVKNYLDNQAKADVKANDILNKAIDTGWMYAGAYYYYIARQNSDRTSGANPVIGMNTIAESLNQYRNNYRTASGTFLSSIVKIDSGQQPTDANGKPVNYSTGGASVPSDDQGSIASFANELNPAGKSIMDSFMYTVSGSQSEDPTAPVIDPISKLQALGQKLLLSVEIIYPVVLAISAGLAALLTASTFTVLGTGVTGAPYSIMSMINSLIIPVIFALLAALLAIGGTLAVYVPLIPYVVFTVGVIGWFGSTIEAMVAAPLLALGILSPSANHHEVLGKAEPGLMLLFSIFLRPSLMIFGLIAGMLLAGVGISIVNASFGMVMGFLVTSSSRNGQTYVDLLELIFFMISYVFLVITIINKTFALIHIIPTRTMRWIQGEAADYGEGEALQEMRGGVGAASSQMGQEVTGRGQAAGQGGSAIGKFQGKKATNTKGKGPGVQS